MQLSTIIVNYNVRDLLMDAIASLKRAMEGIDGEIIVVDNASTDGAIEMLNRDHPDVVTVQLDRNYGFGVANNAGIERAKGEFILLINPDTVVQEDTLRTMLKFMRSNPKAGVAGCKILNPDGSFEPASKRGFPSPWSSFSRVFGFSRLFPKSKLFGGYNLTWLDSDTTCEVEALSGCFMFFRGSLVKQLKGFDPDFFMYGEDLDLCWRVKQEGWQVWYHPATNIIHLKGESTRRSSLDSIAMFYDAMEIFARKHFRRNQFLLWLVRRGIALRRSVAKVGRLYPHLGLAAVDLCAVLLGFILSTIFKVGSLAFPEYAVPWVFIAPPVAFIGAVALAGGYGPEANRLSRTLLGYLGGFFALSTLPYFFEAYRFSRGIVLATTGLTVVFGITARFLILLYERTYGRQSGRRVGFISRNDVGGNVLDRVRRQFLGRPVKVVGVITPTFSGLDRISGNGLGTIENVARIVHEHRLTDIFVVDTQIGYGDVIEAIRHAAGQSVRFHLMRDTEEDLGDELLTHPSPNKRSQEPYGMRIPISRRLQGWMLAAILLLVLPIVYLFKRNRKVTAQSLLSVLLGKRPLVRGGTGTGDEPAPVFSAAALFSDEDLDTGEMDSIERYYEAHRSLLLDCQIIVTSLRFADAKQNNHVTEPEAAGSS